MTHGSLFSGGGGFDLAAQWAGWTNVFNCEIDSFCKHILKYYWPDAIQYDDIRKTDFTIWQGRVNVLTGGFPCQDASIAKQHGTGQLGLLGKRTGLAFEMLRAIDEIRPDWVVPENVSNIINVNGGWDFARILDRLSAMGYSVEWKVFYASDFGFPHKRSRCYMVAYSDRIRLHEGESFFSNVRSETSPKLRELAGATCPVRISWNNKLPVSADNYGLPDGLPGFSSKSKLRKEVFTTIGMEVIRTNI